VNYRPVQVDLPNARLKHSPAAVWMGCLFAFLGLVSPTVVNYSPYGLSWDPAYYLHNAICMNHAVYSFSLSRVAECLSHTAKGPIMELVTLPWGRTGGTYWGIGLAFAALALFIWIMVLATYLTCLRGRIPPVSLLLAAGCICLTPLLRESGGAMMTDMLLAWCIALALMLIPLEFNEPQTEWWPSIFRGFLWGIVINVGMLSKVTFGFFAGAIGLVLVAIRWRRSGIRPLLCAISGCLAGAAPALLIWLIYGRTFLRFAMLAAWGFGDLYSVPGMTAVGYWRRYFGELRWALIPLLILFALFIRGLLIEKQGRLVRLVPIGIVLIYLATASASQNRDPRFTIPVMIAMPLCLAWTNLRSAYQAAMRPAPVLAALLVATLFAIPMVGKPNIVPIEHAGELLLTLSQGRPTAVLLGTDGGFFNVETVELARQIGGDTLRPVSVDTLVYDEVNKRSLEEGFERIDKADYVLFLKPGNSPGPDWTMRRAKDYRAHCEKVGTLMSAETSSDFDVFKVSREYSIP
jgi:hypothetical protein